MYRAYSALFISIALLEKKKEKEIFFLHRLCSPLSLPLSFFIFYFLKTKNLSPDYKGPPFRNCSHSSQSCRCTDKCQVDSRICRIHNRSPDSNIRLRRRNSPDRCIRCPGSRMWSCSLRRSTCRHSCRARCPRDPVRSRQCLSRNTNRSNRERRCTLEPV